MFESDQFTESQLVCFEQSPKKVNFFSTLQLPTTELIDYLESWVNSGPNVIVQQQSLAIDSNCMVRVSNIQEECALEFALMQETVNEPLNVPIISFLGIVVTALILSLLAVSTACYIKTRMKQQRKYPEVKQEPSPL